MNDDFINIVLGSSDWEFYHRKEFTKDIQKQNNNVIFVNYPLSLSVNLFVKFKTKFIGYFTGKYKTKTLFNIVIYTPVIFTHTIIWSKIKIFAYIDNYLLSYQINKFVNKLYKSKKIRLWVYIPENLYLLKFIKYDELIFDSYDDNELDVNGEIVNFRKHLNEQLVRKSNLTCVLSDYTFNKFKKYSPSVFKINIGYNIGLFKDKYDKMPDEFVNLNKPILGYVGAFRNWIDYDIIDSILNEGSYYLCVIGYIDKSSKKYFDKIKNHKNLIYINHISNDKVPHYLPFFSAGLIPFKINNFMKSVYPNKFAEYLAAGIPIITTALPELEKYNSFIGYSYTKEEFLVNCRKVISEGFMIDISQYSKTLELHNSAIIVNSIFQQLLLNK